MKTLKIITNLIIQQNNTAVWLLLFLSSLRIFKLSLSLLMLGILTDNSDASLSLNDFAFIANGFYR